MPAPAQAVEQAQQRQARHQLEEPARLGHRNGARDVAAGVVLVGEFGTVVVSDARQASEVVVLVGGRACQRGHREDEQ